MHNALTDENGFRGPGGIPQIVRYEYGQNYHREVSVH